MSRHAVRFVDGVRTVHAEGARIFLELGPHGVLSALAQGILDEEGGGNSSFIPMLRKGRDETEATVAALANLYVAGSIVDWPAFFAPYAPRRVALPTYAFQRERFWLEAPKRAANPAIVRDDDKFWAAVENEDLDVLGGALQVDDDTDHQALATVLPKLSNWRRQQHTLGTINTWRYRIYWKPLPGTFPRGDLAGPWLVLVPAAAVARDWALRLERGLTDLGAEVTLVEVGEAETDRTCLGPAAGRVVGRSAFIARYSLPCRPGRAAAAERSPSVPTGLALTFSLFQALDDLDIEVPVWSLSRGAVSVGRSDRLESPVQALLWGFGLTAGLDVPQRWGGLLDVPIQLDNWALERVLAALANDTGEDQLAVRSAGIFARRLVRAPMSGSVVGRGFKPSGTILITGGTGAIGGHVARWLARQGAEHLVLVSRQGAKAPNASTLSAELATLGTRVTLSLLRRCRSGSACLSHRRA